MEVRLDRPVPMREFFDLEPVDDPGTRIVIEILPDRQTAERAPRLTAQAAELESEQLCYWFGGVNWLQQTLSPLHAALSRQLASALADRLRPVLPAGWMEGQGHLRRLVLDHLEASLSHVEELGEMAVEEEVKIAV